MSDSGGRGEWVLLSYRLPREPSTPRTAVWRKLKRLGVAQLGDGLVALPTGARTREQLEWIAEEVVDAGGAAAIWLARPATQTQEHELSQAMAAVRSVEYQAVIDAAAAAETADSATRAAAVRRLRHELRAIQHRDYFPPPERERAEVAVQDLAGRRVDARPQPVLPAEQAARRPSMPAGEAEEEAV